MKLLDEVKNYLDITWETTETEDAKLESMIERAKDALTKRIGECDFDEETQEKTLLLNHVMYERDKALPDFWRNYSGDVISLRIRKKVQSYETRQ
ncbi:MAG: phage head-tail connector protein [Lachnospiraceae bacterium]|uniref:phage head-tail connector protein n=1 Tax=Parablautia sp. Marseille-Q6255 TaxID=3039593 RepID=UPI0024BD5403|nr:phage head-tail connector protein [Parablautia sp. Marseille-Q6255]